MGRFIHKSGLPIIVLKPGELALRSTPTIISTALGSCLAITMYAPERRIGAISHPLLPYPFENIPPPVSPVELRKYVVHVIPSMLKKLEQLGVVAEELEVKVFGGGEILQRYSESENNQAVGRMNVQAMLDIILSHNLFLRVFDVGGSQGRKVLFYTHTGEVFMKRLNNFLREE
ncbi:MAG: chemotaxis protein CheD [bacterium]|nr:chemotaxis protein CheD [bacterium]